MSKENLTIINHHLAPYVLYLGVQGHPVEVTNTDYHRLPEQPISRNNHKVHRPIIIKLANSTDKKLIFTKLKNLKKYNEIRKSVDKKPHYVTEHLPKQLQQERKALLRQFKEAKRMKKKVSWRAENGHYCLYVNNVKVDFVKSSSSSFTKL